MPGAGLFAFGTASVSGLGTVPASGGTSLHVNASEDAQRPHVADVIGGMGELRALRGPFPARSQAAMPAARVGRSELSRAKRRVLGRRAAWRDLRTPRGHKIEVHLTLGAAYR